MFDAILDTAHAAVNKARAQGLELVVSETGWLSGAAATGDTVENSAAYNNNNNNNNNNNVLRHVAACTGTPRQPGKAVEKYMFAMFNENQKPEGMEQQFGLFEPDMTAVYRVDFAGSY